MTSRARLRPSYAVIAFFALLCGLILLAQAGAGAAAGHGHKGGKGTKVKVKVATKSQQSLLSKGKLKVKVSSDGRAKVKVNAKSGKSKKRLFKTAKVKLRKGGKQKRTVKLKLTGAGEKKLGSCGSQVVKVTGRYRGGGKRHTARASRTLKRDKSKCSYEPVPLENADRCDFLDPAVCLQPFPNDYFTVDDPSTATGKRLNLNPESTPANTDGVHIDPTDMNRGDGFSPGNEIIVKVPGLETPKAFENSGIVPIDDLRAYDDPGQAVIVINADTGERQPIWAELDANPTAVDATDEDPGGIGENPSNTGPVNLIIRPARNFDFGGHYIVALRNLKDAQNNPIGAPIGFRVYRDELVTDQEPVEARRPHMESLISTLTDEAGVARNSLYMAWDFTVASQDSVTGRATEIRDDAFARLGDDDLSDRTIDGDSPGYTITGVYEEGDPIPEGDRELPDQILRRVTGTIEVPCYLNQDGCPTGASFSHDDSGEITWNPNFTADVPFRCEIPNSVETLDPGHITPAVPGTYGHGLLGDQKQVTGQANLADRSNTIWCAMDWVGFSSGDIGTVLSSLKDMSNFNKLVDRMQQGFVNFMYLGRALIHPDGLSTDDAFKIDPDGPGGDPDTSVIATDGDAGRINYMGISQGAIMGGALTALEPDTDRTVLNVPGINYSTLLRRSVDSDDYFKLPGAGLYDNYPDELERPVLLSLIQLLWDRGEGNGFAHNMTDSPLENTNPHEVLLQPAIGDHQVANVTAEVEARTIGASVYTPALNPGRHWEDQPFMDIPAATTFPFTEGSLLVYYDGGPVGFVGTNGDGTATPPNENVPPRTEWGYGGDPHGYPRSSEDGLTHAEDFLAGSGIDACPNPGGYCYSNGYTGP